jgi:hypothetical protein
MADSTTNLNSITANTVGAAAQANALIDAASPATLFGRNAVTTSALTWGFFGGKFMVDGLINTVTNGTVTLAASSTNYVEATRAGVVSRNTVGFTAGRIPLYQIDTTGSTVVSWQDWRTTPAMQPAGRLQLAMTDANQTLTVVQARCRILRFTGTLTAQRNIVLPLAEQEWIVQNNTTGGFGLQFIGATGTGVVVAAARHAIVYSDGTNVVRVTPDQA